MASKHYYIFSIICFTLIFTGLTPQCNIVKAQTPDADSLPSFSFAGFVQQQFIVDQTPDSPARFAIHRARLGLKGALTDRITVNLVGGYAEPPNNTPRLVNAFIDFDIHPLLQLRTGQFLLPFGLEGPQPIFLSPTIERTTAVRRLNTFTMFRDVGIRLSGAHSIFSYAVALVNGAGANNIEQFDSKDIMGRFAVDLSDQVEIGVSGHVGNYQSNPATEEQESRYKAGADLNVNGDPVFLRAEYIFRSDELEAGDQREMIGGYLLGGYAVTENLEAIARYEYYDPNTSLDDDRFTAFTLAANYYFVRNSRLSVNYEVRDDQLNTGLGNLLAIQMQLTF